MIAIDLQDEEEDCRKKKQPHWSRLALTGKYIMSYNIFKNKGKFHFSLNTPENFESFFFTFFFSFPSTMQYEKESAKGNLLLLDIALLIVLEATECASEIRGIFTIVWLCTFQAFLGLFGSVAFNWNLKRCLTFAFYPNVEGFNN